MDLIKETIKSLHEKLIKREISAAELCGLYTKRVKELNPELNAVISVTEEEALKNAENAQVKINADQAGVLTGIPVLIKDNICTDGLVTTCASKMLENFIPPYDAGVIECLKKEDYVLLGKANMGEFGTVQTSAFGEVKNPLDKTCTAGGSSGGSAAAVSAGLSAYSIGSDTGGGIRQPAAFCGVTGLKPTYGRVSRFGLTAFGSSLEQIGPIAKTAEDAALILNVISAHDPRDATMRRLPAVDFTEKIGKSINGMKIALPLEFFGGEIDAEVKDAVMSAAKELEKQGAVLIDCTLPSFKYAVAAYYIISSAEASSNISRFDGVNFGLRGEGASYMEQLVDSRSRGFGDEVKRRVLLGNFALSKANYDDYFIKAQAIRQQIIKEYDEILEKADIILTPTMPCTAPKLSKENYNPEQAFRSDICTVTANLTGLPAITTPCKNSGTLPIGMTLTGKKFDEQTIIQAADCYEKLF